ncbi:MAG: DUF1800 domain-containing protein [Chloroflexi bacterium]|nr:DUF1800 domain-containing protein [Chloroflexota bacterium]MBI3741743.1 DUF1800 domain-containing protein [Chloroflexota bacterium]
MDTTRREFLQDLAFAAALVGLPSWATELDETPPAEMMSFTSYGTNPWQWKPASAIGKPNFFVTVLNRLGYGPRPGDVERVQKIGVDAYVDQQLHPETIDDSALEQRLAKDYPTLTMGPGELRTKYPFPTKDQKQQNKNNNNNQNPLGALGIGKSQPGPEEVVMQLEQATVLRAVMSQRQLFESLVEFWSDHFNIYIRKDDNLYLKTIDDRDVIRKHALGKFSDLLLASAQSPAMLTYLDNRENTKGVANENYAREIMELHSLGVDGGYTQKDVAELARAFTGWQVTPPPLKAKQNLNFTNAGKFIYNARQHDDGAKTILGINLASGGGMNDALKIIDALAHHPSTAKFIARKLVKRYVSDTPPDALVERAAATFKQTDGDLRAVLGTILHSDEFNTSNFLKIKRPYDYTISAARAVNAQMDDARALAIAVRLMGQGLFFHVTPDGYPDLGSAWINTDGLLGRWNLAMLYGSGKVPRTQIDLSGAMKSAAVKTVGDAVNFWVDYILHREIPSDDRAKIIATISSGGEGAAFDATTLSVLVSLILASPHFQYR